MVGVGAVEYRCVRGAGSPVDGHYLVKKKGFDREREEYETLYLKDARGSTVTAVFDCKAGPYEGVLEDKLILKVQFRLHRKPAVVLETWSGGTHGGNCYFVWMLGHRPKCLLAYNKGNVSDENDFDFVRLGRSGAPQIRTWYDGFAYTVRSSYWNIPLVFRYEHGRYVDRTGRYRRILAKAESEAWREIRTMDRSQDPRAWTGPSAQAITLLAIGDMRHTRAAVWRRLQRALSSRHIRWVKEREGLVLRIISGRTRRLKYPKAYDPLPVLFQPFPTERLANRIGPD